MGNAQTSGGPSVGRRDPLAWGKKAPVWSSDEDSQQLPVSGSDDRTTNSCGLQLKFGSKAPVHSAGFDATNEFPVVLKYSGNAKCVHISGSWDGWKKKIPLVRSTDDFTTILNLPEGRHEFRFIVDGRSICDHKFPRTEPQSSSGPENNLLIVDKADFEVFDALDRDSQDVAASRDPESQPFGTETGATTYGCPDAQSQEAAATLVAGVAPVSPRPFGQVVPDRGGFRGANPPPSLPPHLLQVILNKDTPITCDPNVLPEPNHVMLNHLYALSIKDDVMVLSATHRYRKKYVTTLLYKPI